jgi:hypothetical protein
MLRYVLFIFDDGLFVFDDGLRTLTCAYPPCELFFKRFTAGINEDDTGIYTVDINI